MLREQKLLATWSWLNVHNGFFNPAASEFSQNLALWFVPSQQPLREVILSFLLLLYLEQKFAAFATLPWARLFP